MSASDTWSTNGCSIGMGTNYYLISTVDLPPCFERPQIHIGKSSGGWCFALHVYPNSARLPHDLSQWMDLMENLVRSRRARIEDEETTNLSVVEMRNIIVERSWTRPPTYPDKFYRSAEEFHQNNQSQPGPNGLVRARIDGIHCVGHGEGTWDHIVGDFS